MLMFNHFFCFRPRIPFLGKFGPKICLECLFKVRFGTRGNPNMQNAMESFTFPIFDGKYPFWANLV